MGYYILNVNDNTMLSLLPPRPSLSLKYQWKLSLVAALIVDSISWNQCGGRCLQIEDTPKEEDHYMWKSSNNPSKSLKPTNLAQLSLRLAMLGLLSYYPRYSYHCHIKQKLQDNPSLPLWGCSAYSHRARKLKHNMSKSNLFGFYNKKHYYHILLHTTLCHLH